VVFAPGAAVVWRSLPGGVVGTVRGCRVVRDDDDLIALTILPGYPLAQRTGIRGGPGDRLLIDWDGGYAERRWLDKRCLVLYRPGDASSVELFWHDADHTFLGWQIDLQRPWRRTPIGFDSRDFILDLVVGLDGAVRWKDEDELTFAIQQGKISDAEVALARREGERVMRRARARETPFDGSWNDWRPDPTWSPPTLPATWERAETL
jgi:uncharacterized protein DUF402